MAKKSKAKLAEAPQPSAPEPVKASVVFANVIDVMRRGLFTGQDARRAAECIMFLEQIMANEEKAEALKAEAN